MLCVTCYGQIKFHETHYSADAMKLCVLGKENLDTLEVSYRGYVMRIYFFRGTVGVGKGGGGWEVKTDMLPQLCTHRFYGRQLCLFDEEAMRRTSTPPR